MGEIHTPPPVLPIVTVFSRYPEALEWAKARIEREWGEVVLIGGPFPFELTHYYDETMGGGLQRVFFALKPLMEASMLVAMKHQSNEWEDEYARQFPKDEPRPVNIDPGYIDMSKLVLASSKDFTHRIYMADGIFAEITLFYRRGGWQTHDWTFPDFRATTYHPFLSQCRQLLNQERKAP